MGSLIPEAWEAMLMQMEREGIRFYLNGKPSGPREIIHRCCVCGDVVYMPDLVTDEEGRLKEVRYDEVKNW